MSNSNPRGKQRKNGTMQELNGQHMMSAPVASLTSQAPQMMPNGTAAQQQQPTALGFMMPSVDTAHSNHVPQVPQAFRTAPRNFSNPSMQFEAGQVHIERPQGNAQMTTIHPRFSQQPQSQQQFPPTSQIPTYTSAPPMYNQQTYSTNVYSQQGAYPTFQPQGAYFQPATATAMPQQMFTTAPGYYQMQAPAEYLTQRVYPQSMVMSMPPSQPPVPQKGRKILKIVNPDTQEVTNEKEITAYMCAPSDDQQQQHMATDPAQGGRRSATLENTQPQPSNASQKFSLQVAQSVLGDSAVASSSSAVLVDSQALGQPTQAQAQVPPTSVQAPPPTPVVPPPVTAEVSREVSPAPSPATHQVPPKTPPQPLQPAATCSASVSVSPSPAHVEEMPAAEPIEPIIEEKPPEVVEPPKQEPAAVEVIKEQTPERRDESEKEQAPQRVLQPSPQPVKTVAEGPVHDVTLSTEPEEHKSLPHTDDQPTTTTQHHVVESVPEVTEKEEKAEEEPAEVKLERKRKELEAKHEQLIVDTTHVDMEGMVYGRSYLMLMREVVKELRKDSCPVEETELKTLGIDIASAPAVGSLDRQQRRLDGMGGASRAFAPGWMQDNKSQKHKPYLGRLSDRGHSQRDDRGRRRGPISRPSIDRPAREPVKLHKSENAWKHDAAAPVEASQVLYKDVRGLLNKITPSTFDTLSADFLLLKVYENREQMSEIIDIIFDKAVEEPKFCPLYSDLCKKQVVEESQESGKSEFRSGILTRCQQTFETKRQDEIKKKRAEMEAETDDRHQKELKLELMEMENKERRRMFGNIGFIGQLFRHELIVPRILNWCIIHLLKNHSDAKDGDEESIECAVRMLETVGKIADRQGLTVVKQGGEASQPEFNLNLFFTHLSEIVSNVSNRVRFLIMNLMELKKNNWNPRKTVESGPKTIEEVHNEARNEEIQNKLQREQYEKKRGNYEGRASLDRRNQRPTIIGRQSQDGRYGRGDRGDQKARAAGAASMVASTASRKNQSLNSMDQPQSLGARRPQFSSGSAGGGQQPERNVHASRNVMGVKGAGRGTLASRDNSQPSSREPSESRRQSSTDERNAALAAASAMTHSSSSGGLGRGTGHSVGGGGSSSALSEHAEDPAARAAREKKAFSVLNGDLSDYFVDNVDVEQVYAGVNEVMETSPVRVVFRLIMQVGVEKVGGMVTCTQRRYVGQVVCRCLQNTSTKQEALLGVADYCTHVVDTELWEDNMRVWEAVAEIISWSIMCDTNHFEGARPAIADFRDAFTNANLDTRKPDALLFYVLKRLIEIEYEREKHATSVGMAFAEIKELHSAALLKALDECHISSGESLSQLLK